MYNILRTKNVLIYPLFTCVLHGFQVFAYDYCFWSMDESEKEKYAGELFHHVHSVAFLNLFQFRHVVPHHSVILACQVLLMNLRLHISSLELPMIFSPLGAVLSLLTFISGMFTVYLSLKVNIVVSSQSIIHIMSENYRQANITL